MRPSLPSELLRAESLRQADLLARLLAPWSGPGERLLLVNCGAGRFVPLLLRLGFALSATERNDRLRLRALGRGGGHVEMLAAEEDDLPFGDNAFDWVLLHTRKPAPADLARAVGECARVAAQGVAVTFWNSCSAGMLGRKVPVQGHPEEAALPWWRLWRVARRLPGRVLLRTAGFLPPCVTRRMPQPAWRWAERLPLGVWGAARVDLRAQRPLTGLPLRVVPPLASGAPALD